MKCGQIYEEGSVILQNVKEFVYYYGKINRRSTGVSMKSSYGIQHANEAFHSKHLVTSDNVRKDKENYVFYY